MVPFKGTWTVTSTNGSLSASQNVSITAQGQGASITLIYDLILFDAGVKVPMSKGYGGASSTVTFGNIIDMYVAPSDALTVLTTDTINLSKYKTLYATVTEIFTYQYGKGWLVVDTDRNTNPYNYGNIPGGFSAITQIPNASTVGLDISSLYGNYYVGIGYGAGNAPIKVSKMWLAV